ncbi:MAG TPA: hypothetical protein VHQ00_16485, partial [Chloroflexota bacterium]|nr:hypothetical protein [Chloroflexota bacterium]
MSESRSRARWSHFAGALNPLDRPPTSTGGGPAGRGPGAPSRRALLLVAAGAAGTLSAGALGFGAGG